MSHNLSFPLRPPRLPTLRQSAPHKTQRGVVIVIALVVLVIMTLSAIALMRSVSTSNLVSGNLAFHQAATQAADRSTEAALSNFLIAGSGIGKTALHGDNNTGGYFATRGDPSATQSWDAFWQASLDGRAVSLGQDAAGNTVRYVIHRLCETTGQPQYARCASPPATINAGGSQQAGGLAPITNPQVYYRITTRIEGPRNTVSYTQTIVAL